MVLVRLVGQGKCYHISSRPYQKSSLLKGFMEMILRVSFVILLCKFSVVAMCAGWVEMWVTAVLHIIFDWCICASGSDSGWMMLRHIYSS